MGVLYIYYMAEAVFLGGGWYIKNFQRFYKDV